MTTLCRLFARNRPIIYDVLIGWSCSGDCLKLLECLEARNTLLTLSNCAPIIFRSWWCWGWRWGFGGWGTELKKMVPRGLSGEGSWLNQCLEQSVSCHLMPISSEFHLIHTSPATHVTLGYRRHRKCACVRVCERACVRVWACVRACVRVCVCVCARARVRANVCSFLVHSNSISYLFIETLSFVRTL